MVHIYYHIYAFRHSLNIVKEQISYIQNSIKYKPKVNIVILIPCKQDILSRNDSSNEIIEWLTNEILPIGNYKADVGEIIIDVISINYYQNSYQEGTFYYQDIIDYFYVFVNEECNSFNFGNQINPNRYYLHSKMRFAHHLNQLYSRIAHLLHFQIL